MSVFSWFRRTSAPASGMPAAAAPVTPDPDPARMATGTQDGSEGADTAPERVEIPKQQSAEAAADNETGENARK